MIEGETGNRIKIAGRVIRPRRKITDRTGDPGIENSVSMNLQPAMEMSEKDAADSVGHPGEKSMDRFAVANQEVFVDPGRANRKQWIMEEEGKTVVPRLEQLIEGHDLILRQKAMGTFLRRNPGIKDHTLDTLTHRKRIRHLFVNTGELLVGRGCHETPCRRLIVVISRHKDLMWVG